MPLFSSIARQKKVTGFLDTIGKDAAVLEIGCADGWVGAYMKAHGWRNYTGVDLHAPADVVGDITAWRSLGLTENSYDVIIAFEVIEHVDVIPAALALLKDGGRLMLTSPLPHMDWVMWLLELVRLNQKRTSPHAHLRSFKTIEGFRKRDIRVVGGLSQWGIFTK